MTLQNYQIPKIVKQARRKILGTASEARKCLGQISLTSSAFQHHVVGFSLLEELDEQVKIRWMCSESRFQITNKISRLEFKVRSHIPENRLTIKIDGTEIGNCQVDNNWLEDAIELPASKSAVRTLLLQSLKSTYPPNDTRELGLMFQRLNLIAPDSSPLPIDGNTAIPQPQSDLVICELPEISVSPRQPKENNSPDTPLNKVIISLKYFRPHDAISHEVLAMADLCREEGLKVYILAEETHSDYTKFLGNLEDLTSALNNPHTLLVHHHGTRWAYGDKLFQTANIGARLLRYHNVSLSECFLDYPFGYLDATIDGRFDTVKLVNSATLTAAASYWALSDLIASGANPDRIRYLPFLHDLEALENQEPNQMILRKMKRQDTLQFLVIGRQVPSKGLHHVLKVLREYNLHFHEKIHVWIVGAIDPLLRAYHEDLQSYVLENELTANVTFEAEADRASIAAYLWGCDALVTMSESDAAAIPILEAAWLGKPTIGLNRGGKGEHAGPGQLIFDSLDYRLHAEAWHQFVTQPKLRHDLGSMAQHHVKCRFSGSSVQRRFLELLSEFRHNSPVNQPPPDNDRES